MPALQCELKIDFESNKSAYNIYIIASYYKFIQNKFLES